MSVKATTTVSTVPASMSERSWSRVSVGAAAMGAVLSDEAAQEGGGGVAVLLHGGPGAFRVASQDRGDDVVVLGVRVLDVAGQDGDRRQHLVQRRLRARHGVD